MLMNDLLPILQPVKMMTSLYGAGCQPFTSALYPALWSFIKVILIVIYLA